MHPLRAVRPAVSHAGHWEDCAAIDGEKCIACFRCVKNCPVQAKGVFTPEYQSFAAAFSEKLKEPKENQYFLGRG